MISSLLSTVLSSLARIDGFLCFFFSFSLLTSFLFPLFVVSDSTGTIQSFRLVISHLCAILLVLSGIWFLIIMVISASLDQTKIGWLGNFQTPYPLVLPTTCAMSPQKPTCHVYYQSSSSQHAYSSPHAARKF